MKWIEIAENLPLNTNTRVKCCGRNRDAIISSSLSGYSYYCFKCDSRLFHSVRSRTLQQLLNIQELNEQPPILEIPGDFTPVIPLEHCLWLYKAGISNEIYTREGIGWSDSLQRIIIPIYNSDGDLTYFQCRAVHKGQIPKYKNPQVSKSRLLYFCGIGRARQRIVVTEDILSAIRVGKHTPACSLLGTKTSDEQAGMLSDYKLVSYWLDPDKAGIKGAREGALKVGLATKTEILTSKVDPKHLSDRVLREILKLPPNKSYTYHGCITPKNTQTQRTL